jgi:hypothetical protein
MQKNCLLCFDNEGCTAPAKHQTISFLPDLVCSMFQMNLLPPSTLMTEATGSSKHWHISTRLEGVTFQKAVIFSYIYSYYSKNIKSPWIHMVPEGNQNT